MSIAVKLLIVAGIGIVICTAVAFYAIGTIDQAEPAWSVSPVPEFAISVPGPIVPAPSPAPSPCACTRPHHGHRPQIRR